MHKALPLAAACIRAVVLLIPIIHASLSSKLNAFRMAIPCCYHQGSPVARSPAAYLGSSRRPPSFLKRQEKPHCLCVSSVRSPHERRDPTFIRGVKELQHRPLSGLDGRSVHRVAASFFLPFSPRRFCAVLRSPVTAACISRVHEESFAETRKDRDLVPLAATWSVDSMEAPCPSAACCSYPLVERPDGCAMLLIC